MRSYWLRCRGRRRYWFGMDLGKRSWCLQFRRNSGSSRCIRLPAQDLQGADGGGVAAFDAEFFVDVNEMLFDGGGADVEDEAGLGVAFALGDPVEDFGLTR